MPSLLWQEAQRFYLRLRCCSSSVVEHSLGKGEVESSILSCSTITPPRTLWRLQEFPPIIYLALNGRTGREHGLSRRGKSVEIYGH
jgi:hypothetical protein